MSRFVHIAVLLLAGVAASPRTSQAQSDAVSLGDLARSLRKNQSPPRTVIDNDNLPAVMEQGENKRWRASARPPGLDDVALRTVNAASPDVTCALSFSGQANKDPLDDLIKPQSLPDIELTKLDGPASIVGDSLQISVYNGSGWALREITVGFTVVRRHIELAAELGEFRLMPAAISSPVAAEKPPDVTLLYHMKGTAAPSSTTVFQAPLDVTLEPDQEWHWAIVQAKGIPPASAPELPAEPKIQAPN